MSEIVVFSVFCVLVVGVIIYYILSNSSRLKRKKNNKMATKLVGKWMPIELSQCGLEISRYGILKISYDSKEENDEMRVDDETSKRITKSYVYELRVNRVEYGENEHFMMNTFSFNIQDGGRGDMFLEVYNNALLSGKYRKVK